MSGSQNESEYVYLEVDDVLAFYAGIFGYNDQEATDRLRDRAGLEGALGRAKNHAQYNNADIALQGAVLAHGIAEGQYFLEGNKRVALVSLRVFLRDNGYEMTVSQETRKTWIHELSTGLTPDELAARLRSALVPET